MGVRSRRLRRALASTEGWVQPFRLEGGDAARSTVTTIGNLESSHEATVDPRGLVTPGGAWSLDWWVGADDRWHVPSREIAVRQRLVDDAPVVESAMRVPSGDVVQRAFVVRDGADEIVVVEFENTSPVPVALALALRPYDAAGAGRLERIAIDGSVITADGEVALLAPKPPARLAGSTGSRGDVAEVVLAGAAGTELAPVRCINGRATAAFVWPLAHKTTLRFGLPLGPTARTALPTLPSAEQVANGWKLHGGRGLRLVLPDARLASAVDAARKSLLLRHDGPAARVLVAEAAAALGAHGFAEEAGELLATEPEAAGIPALAAHWRRHRDDALARSVAAEVAELAERPGADLDAAVELLAAAGEDQAAESARKLANRRRVSGEKARKSSPVREEAAELQALLDAASPTWTWPEPDLGTVARLLTLARDQLVREVDGGLALCSVVPDTWLGAGIEGHEAPTAYGRLSFGIRWHGERPALLWELDPHPGIEAVRITAPGLDPSWSSTELRGDALLAPVLPAGTPVSLKRR